MLSAIYVVNISVAIILGTCDKVLKLDLMQYNLKLGVRIKEDIKHSLIPHRVDRSVTRIHLIPLAHLVIKYCLSHGKRK